MTHQLQCLDCGAVMPDFARACLACTSGNLIPITTHEPRAFPLYDDQFSAEDDRTAGMMTRNRGTWER
jgi:ribosomal protein L40E